MSVYSFTNSYHVFMGQLKNLTLFKDARMAWWYGVSWGNVIREFIICYSFARLKTVWRVELTLQCWDEIAQRFPFLQMTQITLFFFFFEVVFKHVLVSPYFCHFIISNPLWLLMRFNNKSTYQLWRNSVFSIFWKMLDIQVLAASGDMTHDHVCCFIYVKARLMCDFC